MVISGTPKADQSAFDATEEALSEADWKILENVAPRPIWERIAKARRTAQAEGAERPASAPADSDSRKPTTAPPKPRTDVPITALADGMFRMVYPLRHFGGSTVVSSRDGGTSRRKITLTRVDLKPLVGMVNKGLGDKGYCEALPSENSLVITFDATMKESVLQLLADVDRPPKQVEITARIFEVKHDFDFQLGSKTLLNHIASDNTQSMVSTFSTRAFLNSLSNPGLGSHAFQGSALRLLQVFGDSGISIDVTFQALADTGLIKEIASPRMTVLAGRTGYMLAGQEIPIQSARISNDKLVTERTTYRPVGVQLYVTPQTIGIDSVTLHVLTVVSAVAGFNPRRSLEGADSLQTLVNPIFDSREAETSVTVPDKSTLVIGGLRMVRQITRERKIPGLGDIWGLEWLFKNHRSQREVNDLYFFITPRIIR